MNFIHKDTTDRDKSLLFADNDGDFGDDKFFEFNDSFTLEQLVISLGKFKSATQARKNNWSGPIPIGFKAWKIGKTHFWTWNPIGLGDIND